MIIARIPHELYYLFELLVLIAGFYIIFLLSSSFYLQAGALVLVLIFYTILGILHHEIHHALRRKIVIEYILVSLMILAVFIFLNNHKL
jgi:hypothetical protein